MSTKPSQALICGPYTLDIRDEKRTVTTRLEGSSTQTEPPKLPSYRSAGRAQDSPSVQTWNVYKPAAGKSAELVRLDSRQFSSQTNVWLPQAIQRAHLSCFFTTVPPQLTALVHMDAIKKYHVDL